MCQTKRPGCESATCVGGDHVRPFVERRSSTVVVEAEHPTLAFTDHISQSVGLRLTTVGETMVWLPPWTTVTGSLKCTPSGDRVTRMTFMLPTARKYTQSSSCSGTYSASGSDRYPVTGDTIGLCM